MNKRSHAIKDLIGKTVRIDGNKNGQRKKGYFLVAEGEQRGGGLPSAPGISEVAAGYFGGVKAADAVLQQVSAYARDSSIPSSRTMMPLFSVSIFSTSLWDNKRRPVGCRSKNRKFLDTGR
jgi:hypothetical protein